MSLNMCLQRHTHLLATWTHSHPQTLQHVAHLVPGHGIVFFRAVFSSPSWTWTLTIVFGRSDLLNLDQHAVLHVLYCSHRPQSHGTGSFRAWKCTSRPFKLTLLQDLAPRNTHIRKGFESLESKMRHFDGKVVLKTFTMFLRKYFSPAIEWQFVREVNTDWWLVRLRKRAVCLNGEKTGLFGLTTCICA